MDSLRSQLTEEHATNKKLTEANATLGYINADLTMKLDKLTADNKVTTAKYNSQSEGISKQEKVIQDMQSSQETKMRLMQQRQEASNRQIQSLLARFNTDVQMKNETKRPSTDSSDIVSTPEANHLLRSKKQAERELPAPLSLVFDRTGNSTLAPTSPTRTAVAIATAASIGGKWHPSTTRPIISPPRINLLRKDGWGEQVGRQIVRKGLRKRPYVDTNRIPTTNQYHSNSSNKNNNYNQCTNLDEHNGPTSIVAIDGPTADLHDRSNTRNATATDDTHACWIRNNDTYQLLINTTEQHNGQRP